ncbi:MAG: DUF5615 family PIN-like protein [Candidatus Kapaibacterium sp.]
MRVLLDECVHSRVRRSLASHTVRTVPEVGWRGVKNGELLRLASAEYDVFITSDKNLEYQQHKDILPLPVIVISTKGNMWEDIEPVFPKIEALLGTELKNEFYSVK